MPVDDRNEQPAGSPPDKPEDTNTTTTLDVGAGADASAPVEVAAQRRGLRRHLNRRNALLTGGALALSVVLLLVVAVLLYRTGRIDNIIARQIVTTLAQYNIRAEIKDFHTKFGPRTVEMLGVELYDATTNQRLGHVDRLLATVRIEDLYALNLRRNVNLESLDVDGLELFVAFDADGNSNFRNLRLPPPDPNSRILFSYSTARVRLTNGLVHFGDDTHHITGEARNVRATVQPDDPNAPAESRMNTVDLALSDSTFSYDGQPINPIDIEAHARVNQTRAEVSQLTLRSPVAEAHLQGTLNDWRALRYRMQVTSTVDVTQLSGVLRTGTALRGAGNFSGTVTGEGTRYRVEGQVQSDALAAGNIRLKGLNITGNSSGDGANYEAQGRAVAELLTAGAFNLNVVQLHGGVMGTGTDFRFLGDLRAAAARSGANSIAGLIVSDAEAELRDGQLTGTAGRINAGNIKTDAATISGAQLGGVRFSARDAGDFNASASSLNAGAINAAGARLNGASASGITAQGRGGTTNVAASSLRVNGGTVAGAQLGSLNIAGVRLAIRDGGRIEGSSGDINVGTVAFNTGAGKGGAAAQGRADNVRLSRPVFSVEPVGRYRASADLSLGGGVLGDIKLGAARASVVATNGQLQLNNFTAEALNGRANGNAVIATAPSGASRVAATFDGLDVGGLLALATGRAVPVAGATTGTVDLRFPGTDFARATGTLNARFSGESGNDVSGRTPVNGDLILRADRGLFQLEQAALRAGASTLNATGQFSFNGDSNLQVNLASTDAGELQRVVLASGLVPALEDTLGDYGIALAGNLRFDGTVRGQLDAPIIDGRASVGSLAVNGRDLGALTASLDSSADAIRVPDGRLTQPGGGNAQFAFTYPLNGTNNATLGATLERLDLGGLLAALPAAKNSSVTGQLAAVGPTSGRINIAGIPNALSGSADLRSGPGQIGGEPFDEIVTRATFSGTTVNLENLDARFRAGHINATGTVDIDSTRFDLRAKGEGVQLGVIAALTGGAAPPLTGTTDFTANASGVFRDPRSINVQLNGQGRDVTINGQPAGTLALVGRTENQRFNLQLTTGLLGQPQVITASVDLSNENLPTTIETTLTNTDLTQLFATLLPDANVRVTGRATGSLRASGDLFGENAEGERAFSIAALRGTATFTELIFQVADVQLAAASPLVVQFTPNEITFERTQFTGPGTNVTFGGTAALREGGRQNFSVNGDLNLRVLNGLSPNVFVAGTARVEVRVGGTFAAPRTNGTASVAGASFSTLLDDQRLTLANINGAVRFTANQVQIDSLTGTLGGGRVAVTGGALLDGYTLGRFRLTARADDVTVPFPRNLRSTADADLVLQGSLAEQLLSGTVTLQRAEYTEPIEIADFINRRPEATITESGGSGTSAFGSNLALDLRVEGRDALVVRNNLADAVGSVALRITGSAEDPLVSGRITATRGTLNFRNDRYELTRALIDLPARRGADPILNVQAESEIKGYRVIVALTGPLSQPTAIVRSEPSLPQADVVALITTGSLSTGDESASTLAQTGLGTATSLLTDTLINAPVQRATDRLFGLNRFEIDPLIGGRGGASPTARLTVGRRINRNLSVTYSTNVTTDQNQVVAFEYRVSDRLSFVAQYEQGAINSLRSQNSNFSFEIRFRKRF